MQKTWATKPPPGATINWGHPLAKGLAGCWLFNEGAGAFVRDIAGQRNGAVTGGLGTDIVWAPGRTGIALKSVANAGSSRISIPNTLASGTVWTWEGAVTATTFTDSWGAIHTQAGGNGLYIRSSATFRIEGGATNLSTATTLVAGTRYHIVATADGTTLRIYLNGKLDNSGAGSANFTADSMFNNSGSDTFDGVIEWQRLWVNRVLTATEAQRLFSQPFEMFTAPAIRGLTTLGGSSFGELIGSTSLTLSPSATISAWGALIASANLSFTPSATISAFGALTGATSFTFVPAGNISGLGSLIGSTSIAFTLACNSSSFGELIGSAGITFTPSATISGYALGLGNASISFTPTGNISAIGALIGTTGIAFAVALNSSGDVILFPVDITGTVVNTACTWGFPRATATTETPRAECNDFAIV